MFVKASYTRTSGGCLQNLLTLAPLVDETRILIKVYDTGTWAHINVKLLHYSIKAKGYHPVLMSFTMCGQYDSPSNVEVSTVVVKKVPDQRALFPHLMLNIHFMILQIQGVS